MGNDRYDQLVQEFLGKKRIAIWGMEDSRLDPGEVGRGQAAQARDRDYRGESEILRRSPAAASFLADQDRSAGGGGVSSMWTGRKRWRRSMTVSPQRSRWSGCTTHSARERAFQPAIDKLRSAGCAVIPGLCPMFLFAPSIRLISVSSGSCDWLGRKDVPGTAHADGARCQHALKRRLQMDLCGDMSSNCWCERLKKEKAGSFLKAGTSRSRCPHRASQCGRGSGGRRGRSRRTCSARSRHVRACRRRVRRCRPA